MRLPTLEILQRLNGFLKGDSRVNSKQPRLFPRPLIALYRIMLRPLLLKTTPAQFTEHEAGAYLELSALWTSGTTARFSEHWQRKQKVSPTQLQAFWSTMVICLNMASGQKCRKLLWLTTSICLNLRTTTWSLTHLQPCLGDYKSETGQGPKVETNATVLLKKHSHTMTPKYILLYL